MRWWLRLEDIVFDEDWRGVRGGGSGQCRTGSSAWIKEVDPPEASTGLFTGAMEDEGSRGVVDCEGLLGQVGGAIRITKFAEA